MVPVLLLYKALLVAVYTGLVVGQCPCLPAANLLFNYTKLAVCVKHEGTEIQPVSFDLGSIVRIDSTAMTADCSVIIELTRSSVKEVLSSRPLCPELCSPVPTLQVPLEVLQSINITNDHSYVDFAVTCSMSLQMVYRRMRHDYTIRGLDPIQQFLLVVAQRLLLECKEHPVRAGHNENDVFVRRKVKAVVIWVGSQSNIRLIEQQAQVLIGQPHHGDDSVVAWGATDLLYGCTKEESVCIGNNNKLKHIPRSNINIMKSGWGCAQRRPLRALAHVLKLFDPLFVISLDDDSFLNYPLLMQRYGALIEQKLRTEPVYLGEFSGRTGPKGDLTTNGLFVGGAGYILGYRVLNRLVRKEIHAYGYEAWPGHPYYAARERQVLLLGADKVRSAEQIRHLSVLAEGVEMAAAYCPANAIQGHVSNTADTTTDHNRCILSLSPRPSKIRSSRHDPEDTTNRPHHHAVLHPPTAQASRALSKGTEDGYFTVPLAVRLVDFCTNLMAAANTCQHSDHSLNRCIVYGALATPLGLTCHAAQPPPEIKPEMLIGMCMVAPACNTSEQVTCHRYKATWRGKGDQAELVPVRTTNVRGFYKEYSTLYDPNNVGNAS